MEEVRGIPCREAIGALMWAPTLTSQDFADAVRTLAKFCDSLRQAHWKAVLKVLQVNL